MATTSKMLITLKSGKTKWMTKREYNSYIQRLASLKTVYDQYVEYGYIDPNEDKQKQVQALVELGSNLMCQICNMADSITISGFNRIKNEISDKINKEDFINIVKYVAARLDKEQNTIKDDEKFTAKLLKDIDASIYKINFKRIFYTNYIDFKEFNLPEESNQVVFPKLKELKNNKQFKEIVKSCAKARKYIDSKLWPAFYEYGSVAEYITDGELDYPQYKQLVDYLHYADIEDKRFQSQKKRYKLLIKNFLKGYSLCKKYGYDYFDEVESAIVDQNYDNYLNYLESA